MNLSMFIIGSAVFIIAFSFFKVTALHKTKNQNESWLKLISVFFCGPYCAHGVHSLGRDIFCLFVQRISWIGF